MHFFQWGPMHWAFEVEAGAAEDTKLKTISGISFKL